jgi:hypothetical protein
MTEFVPNCSHKFICDNCDIKTNNKKDFNKHCLTKKHINRTKYIKIEQKNPIFPFICKNCSKVYKARNSLWYHIQKCNVETNNAVENASDINITSMVAEVSNLSNIVIELIKSNTDLQKQMMEVCKSSNTNNSINTINSHNKTFNLQFFLNEQCKDAMNIMDFVNSMTLDFSDLEDVGKLGYVEGISGIIIKKLNEMDIYKRPIHCSDGKREIMFVKDDNVWEKENSTYDRLRKAIKHITKKNGDMMIPWSKKYPACMNIEHHLNDVYVQIMSQSMGGRESFVESENKIMKKIAKAVLIDKSG